MCRDRELNPRPRLRKRFKVDDHNNSAMQALVRRKFIYTYYFSVLTERKMKNVLPYLKCTLHLLCWFSSGLSNLLALVALVSAVFETLYYIGTLLTNMLLPFLSKFCSFCYFSKTKEFPTLPPWVFLLEVRYWCTCCFWLVAPLASVFFKVLGNRPLEDATLPRRQLFVFNLFNIIIII